ncbi:myb family transcription factor APL-like [Durio zibethinus]|uniref:Myb family transcription factor APL-like n=1 Tax=Durio zibethinus TaxID=66656 RepID=A0A6P6A534_DURZI|nr:myb family transcription factor APL-like [Durio zibethinus]
METSKASSWWTVELNERFVELGGPDEATPKITLKIMGVEGLTLYHLKSHLQRFAFNLRGIVRFDPKVSRFRNTKHLQMRIDDQGIYMQTKLEKAAAQTLSEEIPNSQCYKYFETAYMEKQWKNINIKNLESPMVIWSDDLQPDDIVIATPDFHSDGDSFKDDHL